MAKQTNKNNPTQNFCPSLMGIKTPQQKNIQNNHQTWGKKCIKAQKSYHGNKHSFPTSQIQASVLQALLTWVVPLTSKTTCISTTGAEINQHKTKKKLHYLSVHQSKPTTNKNAKLQKEAICAESLCIRTVIIVTGSIIL